MKKLFITLLALFYLSLASGTTLHFHYCMGRLINWGVAHKQISECSNCGMKKEVSSNCCKDQHAKFEVESAQKVAKNTYDFSQTITAVPFITSQDPVSTRDYPVDTAYQSGRLLLRTSSTPAFIRHCTFRI